MLWRCLLLFIAFASTSLGEEKPKQQTRITVSKENTVITEPLDEHGYPDVRRYLNELTGKGVTPETNFVAGFWQATGIETLDSWEMPPKDYFEKLGIETPEPKQAFIDFAAFAKQEAEGLHEEGAEIIKQLWRANYSLATEEPWRREHFPVVGDIRLKAKAE